MDSAYSQSSECCPKFDPAPWNEITFEWNNKQFVRDKVRTLLFIPLNFGGVMKRLDEKVRVAGANFLEGLCLSEYTSAWNMDLFLAVDGQVPDAENVKMSGRYFSKVYEGAFKDSSKWHKDFKTSVEAGGFSVKRTFTWYTTCPKCAKKYGANYVVLLGQI